MSTTFRLSDAGLDDSPPSVAYVTAVLVSAIFDLQYAATEDGKIYITDGDDMIYAGIDVGSAAMAELFVAVLSRVQEQMEDVQMAEEDSWGLKS